MPQGNHRVIVWSWEEERQGKNLFDDGGGHIQGLWVQAEANTSGSAAVEADIGTQGVHNPDAGWGLFVVKDVFTHRGSLYADAGTIGPNGEQYTNLGQITALTDADQLILDTALLKPVHIIKGIG